MKPSRTQAAEGGRVATAPIEDSPVPGALLTLRLMSAGDGADVSWHEGSVVACLASDLIGASGGVTVEAQGPYLMARFAAVHPACIAARRLQWAMQGLAESQTSGRMAFSALVQSGEEASSDGDTLAFATLEKASAGKILVAQRAGKVLEEAPGFATRSSAQGTTEVLWRAPDDQVTRAADDRTIARFIREIHGASAAGADTASPPPTRTTLMAAPKVEKYSISMPESVPRRRNFAWVFGLAAVAVLAAGAYFYYGKSSGAPRTESAANNVPHNPQSGGSEPGQGSSPVPTASQPQNPQTSSGSSGQTGGAQTDRKLSKRERAKLQAQEQGNNQPAEKEKPQPQPETPKIALDVPRGDCQYQQDQIPGLLARAENSRARGQYQDAKRKFAAVLACDRGNHRAEDGLQQVLQALRTEGSSDQ